MQSFNNPYFQKPEQSEKRLQNIMDKYDKSSGEGSEVWDNEVVRTTEINDLEDSNVSLLLGQLELGDNDVSLRQDKSDVSALGGDLFEEMSGLKDKVLGLLRNYQGTLTTKDKLQTQQIRQQIKRDAKLIQNDYEQIIEKINHSVDVSSISNNGELLSGKNEQQINNMFNLVEEFLDKFQGRKATPNLYSTLLRDGLNQSQNQMDMSDTSLNITNTTVSVNDTFYDHQENIDQKIQEIKQQLQSLLQDQSYSQNIILETIEQIQDATKTVEPESIRKIMKRIESQMQMISRDQTAANSTKLYVLLQKSLSYMQQKSEDQNKSILTSSTNSTKPQDPMELRRSFFDEALKAKSELPADHPGKKLLVSMLFDQALQAGLVPSQWPSWIRQQITQK